MLKLNDLKAHLAPIYNEYLFRKLNLGIYMRYPNKESCLPTKLKKVFDGPMKTAVTIDGFE